MRKHMQQNHDERRLCEPWRISPYRDFSMIKLHVGTTCLTSYIDESCLCDKIRLPMFITVQRCVLFIIYLLEWHE